MTYHLFFPPRPALVAHVCEIHRQMGQALECRDAKPDGSCPHVKLVPCDCVFEGDCNACQDLLLVERRN